MKKDMETYEEAANQFIKELADRGFVVKPTLQNRQVLLHLEEPTVCSELVVSVTPTFRSADSDILRTLVNKRRVFTVDPERWDAKIKQAADAYADIHKELTDRHNLKQLRNQEIDILSLPPAMGVERQPDGTYNVNVAQNMSLEKLKKLIEFLKS